MYITRHELGHVSLLNLNALLTGADSEIKYKSLLANARSHIHTLYTCALPWGSRKKKLLAPVRERGERRYREGRGGNFETRHTRK